MFSFSSTLVRSIHTAILLVLSGGFVSTAGQTTPHLTITVVPPNEIQVEIRTSSPTNRWSFRNAIAGTIGLGERIENFEALGSSGRDLKVRKLASGEFSADENGVIVKYKIRISVASTSAVAHVTSLNNAFGLLMLRDLLPQELRDLQLDLKVPERWQVHSSIDQAADKSYHVNDPHSSVFMIGADLHLRGKRVADVDLQLISIGPMPLSEQKTFQSAAKILEAYVRLTRHKLQSRISIALAPLVGHVGSSRWKAETQGSTVVLFVDPRAPVINWQGQMGIIFTHELMHLWVPNSLRLKGDYDWFFEGFTLYTALVTALRQKLITFQEYLATIARVYDSYLSYPDNFSLIDASERRWTGNGAAVYDKGMLVAFLYDLMIRRESHSTKTVTDLYPPLFGANTIESADANDVIIRLLTTEAKSFPSSYIDKDTKLDLENLLPEYGFRLDSSSTVSRLSVSKALTTEQAQLVRSLGFRK
jgi:predicted metalloprotease with PDZ domain